MALQTIPDEARAYAKEQTRAKRDTIRELERIWRGMTNDFSQSFVAIAPALLEVLNDAQRQAARAARVYIPDVMASTRHRTPAVADYDLATDALTGVAGDGRPTESLLYTAVTKAKTAVDAGASTPSALFMGQEFLALAAGTVIADTARTAEIVAGNARHATGWVRMLNPPSCGRCVILAGRHYSHSSGFARHPGCDCRHIPASEDTGTDMLTDPQRYLDGLDESQLRKALGSKANVRAYQDGADLNQLINAYRAGGIRTAQLYNWRVKYTLEGTTRRGIAHSQMSRVRALSSQGEVKAGRYRRLVAPRLMPESIYQIAKTPEHARRLLIDHGWIVSR